jgi:hypothetical protein
MVDVFGTTSTTEEVLSGVNLHGKRILATGVSARNLAKAKTAIAQVLKGGTFNLGSFELIELDLADLKSVRRCANALLAKGEPFFSFFNQRAAEWALFGAWKFTRAHAENFVGCRPAILFASATWSRESEPKYVCA